MAPSPERDAGYLRQVDELIADLTARLDEYDPDELEAEATEGVLKLTFADGSRCVLNRQAAAQQVWLAEGATAWHFALDHERGTWMDTKGRGELRAILGGIIARRLGRPADLGGT